jgi:hypothetical protein
MIQMWQTSVLYVEPNGGCTVISMANHENRLRHSYIDHLGQLAEFIYKIDRIPLRKA